MTVSAADGVRLSLPFTKYQTVAKEPGGRLYQITIPDVYW